MNAGDFRDIVAARRAHKKGLTQQLFPSAAESEA
jgi:hypothetical protein